MRTRMRHHRSRLTITLRRMLKAYREGVLCPGPSPQNSDYQQWSDARGDEPDQVVLPETWLALLRARYIFVPGHSRYSANVRADLSVSGWILLDNWCLIFPWSAPYLSAY